MNKQFSFTLTEQEVNLILESLAKQPLEKVISLFSKIKLSAEEQLKQAIGETKEEEKN